MLITESRVARRLVGRLDRGVNLFEALLAICREHGVRTGEIRAIGSFETVELAAFDQAAKSWRPARAFTGGVEVLALLGNVSERSGQLAITLHATVARDGENGIEVVGGHVVAARVFSLELVIEAFDDVVLRRHADPATGLTQWGEALAASGPAVASTPPPAPAPTWADVARASEERPPAPSATTPRAPTPRPAAPVEGELDADSLEPGDIIVHPTFGRCEVLRIEGSYEFAQVRLKNGRLVRLSLDVLKVVPAGMEGKQRVFRARVDD